MILLVIFVVGAHYVSSAPALSQEECNSKGAEALSLLGEFIQNCSPNAAQKLSDSTCKTMQLKMSSLIETLQRGCGKSETTTVPTTTTTKALFLPPEALGKYPGGCCPSFEGDILINSPSNQ